MVGNMVRILVEIRNRGILVTEPALKDPWEVKHLSLLGRAEIPGEWCLPGTGIRKPLEIKSIMGKQTTWSTLKHPWPLHLCSATEVIQLPSCTLSLLISFLLVLYQVCGWFCYISQFTKAQFFKPGPCKDHWPLLQGTAWGDSSRVEGIAVSLKRGQEAGPA